MTYRSTLVEQTRDELLSELLDGVFGAGSKLPSEPELAKRFRVSRLTIREAVGSLVESGFLSRRHGSGTYVTAAPPRRHALDMTVSYTAMITEAGMRADEMLLGSTVHPAGTDDGERLGIAPDEPVRALERIRTADERPVIYSLDRIPERLVADVSSGAFDASLYAVLEEAGHAVRSASARLRPVVADARLARLLEVKRGSALLTIDETDYDELGNAVMLSAEWHVPDVFELHVNRRANSTSIGR
jgi:GntR family transcriptional regulator